MNTATQLLEQCVELIDQNLSFIDESENLLKDIEAYLAKQQDCNQHPDAPHGFSRNASHAAGRYVCECEGWMPEKQVEQEPMSEDDIRALWKYSTEFFDGLTFARAIEAYHGIK
jgi:hypothetical protein